MTPSPELFEFTRGWEALRTTPYNDGSGHYAIGYGHTCDPSHLPVTLAWAEQTLGQDLGWAAELVEAAVQVTLTQQEFDCLTDFCFNVGAGHKGVKDGFVVLKNGKPSTLLARINALEFDDVPYQIGRWDHAGGRVVLGLTRRRLAEVAIWTDGDYSKRP